MANSLNDALNKPDQLADDAVTTVEVTDASVTAAKQSFVGTGSPTVFGNSIQSGVVVASAGSIAEIAFPTVFGAAPNVVVEFVGGIAAHPSVSAGSAIINTITASASGTWIAIGSGNL